MAPPRSRFFFASCIALVVTAMSFAIRADIMGELETSFSLGKVELGWIAGTAFWGFTLAMVVGGPLCDVLGMGRLLALAFLGHLAGIGLTIFATGFATLYAGTLCLGLANGFVEAACNPLIATLYPEEKTKRLNHFHVWFPGGIVIGGLLAYFLGREQFGYQAKMATMLLPTLAYGALFLGKRFPRTERAASGVTMRAMFAECLRPLFLLMVACMLMTASTELGPGQWLPNILNFSAGVSGILVLAYINGLMACGRQFAGPVVHRLSPSGMLFGSSILAAAGLFALSRAHGAFQTFAAATVFALGVCYFWPTMLGFVSERVPRSGALGLAIMGGSGMLSVSLILPQMGSVYETRAAEALGLPADLSPDALQTALEVFRQAAAGSSEALRWSEAQALGGADTLGTVALLPLVLVAVFGLLYLNDRRRGGYRAERI